MVCQEEKRKGVRWVFRGVTRLVSDPSGAAVSYGDLAAVDDDRHVAAAAAVRQHLVEKRAIPDDVPVIDRPPLRLVGLTGLGRVGSTRFAENDDIRSHGLSSPVVISRCRQLYIILPE